MDAASVLFCSFHIYFSFGDMINNKPQHKKYEKKKKQRKNLCFEMRTSTLYVVRDSGAYIQYFIFVIFSLKLFQMEMFRRDAEHMNK